MIKKTILTLFSFIFIPFLAYSQDNATLTISIFIPPHIEVSNRNDLVQNESTKKAIPIQEKEEQFVSIKNEKVVKDGKEIVLKTVLPK
jgi:hypothetical protein